MEDRKEIEQKINEAMRAFFRPEFLNRVDEVIVFNRLSKEHIRQIVDIQLRTMQERLKDRYISLDVTDQAKDLLGERGYDPAYGARPLRRVIQKNIQDPIAFRMLKGEFKEKDHIFVEANKGEFVFSKR